MKMRVRSLNKNERFPCNPRDVKKIMQIDDDISISFAQYDRFYKFDASNIHPPKIKGTIVASLICNYMKKQEGSRAILCFYVVKENEYGETLRNEFVEQVLPKIRAAYDEFTNSHTRNSSYGINEFLVEFYDNKFQTHVCHYM